MYSLSTSIKESIRLFSEGSISPSQNSTNRAPFRFAFASLELRQVSVQHSYGFPRLLPVQGDILFANLKALHLDAIFYNQFRGLRSPTAQPISYWTHSE